MKVKSAIFFCCLTLTSILSKAQELSQRDKNILRYEAGAFVKEFELLLNNLSNEENAKYERDIIIKNSYTNSGNQIFLNEEVIIEDDINPNNYYYRKVTDLYVEKYLTNFDIFYAKQSSKTIFFSNVFVSEVKQGEYIYLEVYYNSEFKGRHLTYSESYQQTSRVATIIATKKERIWDLKIASIVFYNPKKHSKLFNFISNKDEVISEINPVPNSDNQNNTVNETENTLNLKSQWRLYVLSSLSYESNINRTGLGATLKIKNNDQRISYAINTRYLFSETFNTVDTTLAVKRLSFSGLLFYEIQNIKSGFVPYANIGFNYLHSWVSRAERNQESINSNALGLLVGGGVTYKKEADARLFFSSRLAAITGKASRVYFDVGIGYLIYSR